MPQRALRALAFCLLSCAWPYVVEASARAEEVGPTAPDEAHPSSQAADVPPIRTLPFHPDIYGDVRLRLESDFDSQSAAGVPRGDRLRGRLRLRLGVAYERLPGWKFDIRLRTGDRRSQQSPHLTVYDFDGGARDDAAVGLDRYYARYKVAPWTVTAGRHDFPFWKQNELLWDDDVTALGLSGSRTCKQDCATWTATAGAFTLPDGQWSFSGHLVGGQLQYARPVLRGWDLTAAAGLFAVLAGDDPKHLLTGSGDRDYLTAHVGAELKGKAGGRPLAFGVDLYQNIQSYRASGNDAFAAANRNERTAYVLSARWGQVKEGLDWSLEYYYAHVETLAFCASYAQDDWVRWGSAGQTTSTDFEGHEFRASLGLAKDVSLMARYYLVEAITSVQDGSRFRLDLNIKI